MRAVRIFHAVIVALDIGAIPPAALDALGTV
jgi:hypothetical protein